jgi:VCBS repeat-containing protein
LPRARPSATASITRWSISSGATNTSTLTITITGTNDAPVDGDEGNNVTEDGTQTASGIVLANASDIDHGATLDATLISSPSGTYGSLTAFNTDTGAYTYTLNNGTNGVAGLVQSLAQGETVSDSFNYTVVDQFGATNTSTLTITITGTNDAPVDGDEVTTSPRTARKRQAASCLPTPPTSITARRWMRR